MFLPNHPRFFTSHPFKKQNAFFTTSPPFRRGRWNFRQVFQFFAATLHVLLKMGFPLHRWRGNWWKGLDVFIKLGVLDLKAGWFI